MLIQQDVEYVHLTDVGDYFNNNDVWGKIMYGQRVKTNVTRL